MGLQFDWQVDDGETEDEIRPNRSTPPWFKWSLSALLAIICLSLIGGIWWRLNSAETALRNSVQSVLDLQQQAYADRDGDLFFSLVDSADKAFQSSQLLPDQQRFHATNQLVTKAEERNTIIWANISATVAGEALQRIAFFEQTDGAIRRIATDPTYWGATVDANRLWGTLRTFQADTQWIDQFDDVIFQVTSSIPASPNERAEDRVLIVVIRDDFAVSPIPQIVYYPSPRLVGLNADGQPTDAYYAGLQAAVAAQIAPVKLRFAVPDYLATDGVPIFLQQAAEDFAAQYPTGRLTVELVTAESLTADPLDWIADVDGALLQTTEALVKSGNIYDLTEIAALDREFDQGDFYQQSWRSAWWDERMWFVPWSTSLNLLYVNSDLFRTSNAQLPTADSTWVELEATLAQIDLDSPDDRVFIDPSLDMLYAIAFSQEQTCQEADCLSRITTESAIAALEWYQAAVKEKGILTDLADLDIEERKRTVMGTLSAHKQVAAWVGSPINYEYQIGLQSIRVLPFLEISAETPLRMPLHIHGHVMSSHTEQPYWTWQWLKFLSYQAPPPRLRHIPARQSVTRESGFWEWLPVPIADAYKQVIPNAHPLLIGEETYFTWDQLMQATRADQITPQLAEPSSTKWFLSP